MIVGNGLIANALKPYFSADDEMVVFASGVSNSQETNPSAFSRERELLISSIQLHRPIIYFSTCSFYDENLSQSHYVKHKKEMELLVRNSSTHFIFRLPQVVGITNNPYTLTNYLNSNIKSKTKFKLWNKAERNLIDVNDIALIVNEIVNKNNSMNITINIASSENISIINLVHIFEKILKINAIYEEIDAGGTYNIDTVVSNEIALNLGINFSNGYVERLIKKYYGN
jgi:hypothetical protein